MPGITKKELISRIAKNTNTKRVVIKPVIQCFLDETVAELAKNNRLEFRDFGVFDVRICKARTSLNPKTLEPVSVQAKRMVRFKMGRLMKQKLNGQNVET